MSEHAPQPQITVLGSLHFDIMVRAPGRPRQGETLQGSQWWTQHGGKGGNQAVAASRHGAAVTMIGSIGADEFGERLLTHLQTAQVDARHIQRHPRAGSGMSVAIVDDSGDYGAVIVSGSNVMIDDRQLVQAEPTIAASRLLLLQHEVNDSANIAAARLARQHGCQVLLNAAPAKPLASELTGLIDFLVVNAIEAQMLGSSPVIDLDTAAVAARQLQHLAATVIVTAGGYGVAALSGTDTVHLLPASTVPVLVTHGAGDVFVGALAARLVVADALYLALDYANTAAGLHVSTPTQGQADIGCTAVYAAMRRENPH